MRITNLLGFIFLGLLSTSAVAVDCNTPPYPVLDSVVRLGDGYIEGSGVVVAPNRILTAAHILHDAPNPNVEINGVKRATRTLYVDYDRDVAVLATNTENIYAIPISEQEPEFASAVWAIGFPLGGEQAANMGLFQGAMGNGDLQTTASVNHGQSGGALVSCENGRYVLAGMIKGFGAIDYGDRYVRLDNYSVSVPAETLQNAIVAGFTHTAFYYREEY